jgi:hypothetical protein
MLSASTVVGTDHLYSSGGSMSAFPHRKGQAEPLTTSCVVMQDKTSHCILFKKYQNYGLHLACVPPLPIFMPNDRALLHVLRILRH